MKGLTFCGGWKYEKDASFVVSTVAMSMMLGHVATKR